MRKIKIITLLLAVGLAFSSCKKDEAQTASTTRASTDIATDIAGTWIASSGAGGWGDPFTTVSELLITRIASDKISISSPTGIFPTFTVDRLIIDSDPRWKCFSLQYQEFRVSSDMQLIISTLRPDPAATLEYLNFIGYKQ